MLLYTITVFVGDYTLSLKTDDKYKYKTYLSILATVTNRRLKGSDIIEFQNEARKTILNTTIKEYRLFIRDNS